MKKAPHIHFGHHKKEKGKSKEDDEESSGEEEASEVEEGAKGGKEGTKKGNKKKKKKKKKHGDTSGGYSADVDAAHGKINIEQLSKKEEIFGIRFIVHKARHLAGAISLPMVRIHLETKILRTKPKKGNNPVWNETILFSINKSELDLISTAVEIRVMDSAKTSQHSLIGVYFCDLSVAWVKKGKNLFRRWFALTNPDEPQEGLTGYVNVSIQIIPPGETAKDVPRFRDEEVDRSDNVFFPPGINLQPGQFIVKLYNGEDMPQMDTAMFEGVKRFLTGGEEPEEAPQLVDPYTKVEFAGKVQESTHREGTFDPIWNEQLVLPGQFPSMAENIILKIYDNDDLQVDDLIATKLLPMCSISHASADNDRGFLPQFGPAFIPFYGSPREFSDLYNKYKDMNHGAEEGIAYRGRILVEITTFMGDAPEGQTPKSDLDQEETAKVMMNLGRHKYHLFASFAQGNMILEKENQVEFEVSIGDYGNKFSPHTSPAPSTTQPCNAVYDGTEYHFMPWGRSKPTVILHSEWEDVQHRVGALNTLIWIRDFMQEKIEQYDVLCRAHARDFELDVKFEDNLREILNVLKGTPLTGPDLSTATSLDEELHKYRMFTIKNMIDDVSAMIDGRFMFMERFEKCKKIQGIYEKLESLCVEPQLGIPDVFVWMISGTKRTAYVRIPINHIMYSKSKFERGKHCGSTGSFFLKIPREDRIGAHLTLSLWFGKFGDVDETFKPPRGSEVIVYAETYENQMSVLGNWTTKLLPRPIFSDSTGKYNLPKNSFTAPSGWDFTEGWFITIDSSLTFDNEAGLKEVTDVVYDGETRIPGTRWGGSFVSSWWQDVKGDEAPSKEQYECHEGWKWINSWQVDMNRAVDAEGWEYAVDTNMANYTPIERGYHLSRRKKWHRVRERISDSLLIRRKDIDQEGWEYSKIFTTKFHPKERKFDMVRRRRYNRRLVSNIPRPVVFEIVEEQKGEKPPNVFNMAPRIITEFSKQQVHKYQLRAYLYQARGVLGADPTGYSDPYARVIFGNRSAKTQVIYETVSPVWDNTLILDAVEICGYPDDIASNPPFIVVDLFDEDVLSHDRLGRVVCKPAVFSSSRYTCTKLHWYPISGVKKSKGDLLAAFELFKLGADGMELPLLPPFQEMRYVVPAEIRPKKQLMRVEVLTWGIRNMKDYKMIAVDSPHVDIEIGGRNINIDKIVSLRRHPNFSQPYAYFDVELPVREEYLPPINIRVMDNRTFGHTPLVAVATIKEYGQYRTTYNLPDGYENSEVDLLKEILAGEAEDRAESEGDKGAELALAEGRSVSLNIDVEIEKPASHIALDMEGTPHMPSSDSTAMLIHSEYRSEDSVVLSNPAADYGHGRHSAAQSLSAMASVAALTELHSAPPTPTLTPTVSTVRSAETSPAASVVWESGVGLVSESGVGLVSESGVGLVSESGVGVGSESEVRTLQEEDATLTQEDSGVIGANGVTDIKIQIPQGVIDASKQGTPVDPKSGKKLEEELKRHEKAVKKEAKLRKKKELQEKKDQENHAKMVEKERQKKAKQQMKAKRKAEEEERKKALKKAADSEGSSSEFIPSDLASEEEPPSLAAPSSQHLRTEEVPDKAAGLLGMWYGSTLSTNGGIIGSGGSVAASRAGSKAGSTAGDGVSRLSRKETRKMKQAEMGGELPKPEDILVSDWWSKYYHALGRDDRLDKIFKERNLPVLKCYDEELEKQFDNFRDLMEIMRLVRPDNEQDSDFVDDDDDEDNAVGYFKGSFKIYPITEEMSRKAEKESPDLMFKNLPNNAPQDVLVRVYVIAGINLTPLDFGGSVDPYLYVKCGKLVQDDKSNHITHCINPEFGKMFEFKCSLPRDSQLTIMVYDHDLIGANDLVGSTNIDLEDRLLSWKHASVGVSQQYIIEKENKDVWRDNVKPIGMLKKICVLNGWNPPVFKGKGSTLRCIVNQSEYKMKYFESGRAKKASEVKRLGSDEHRLALYVLHELGVVPEHFETRTLYNEDCPGIPQGKIHLWVDVFPYDRNLPPPIDISPRKTERMVLRIIVWDTMEVTLSDVNIMGQAMSDIFVKIHLEGMPKNSQETDVHFRSLTGEGNFNWRMCYDFEYLQAEQKLVIYHKASIFSFDKEMMKVNPLLYIRVYDYDIFSSDDMLGDITLNLVSLIPPVKTAKECNLKQLEKPDEERISLFDKKKIKGFWPIYSKELEELGESPLSGKVLIELEILPESEALEKPAGQGRSDPNEHPTLEPPDRPQTSFSWFMNPWNVFKILIWQPYKWYIIGALLLLVLIAFIGLLIYTSPGAITMSIFG